MHGTKYLIGLVIVGGLGLSVLGCASAPGPAPAAPEALAGGSNDRMVVRTGELQIEVENPPETFPEAELIVKQAGGFVEHSTAEETVVRVYCRVPSAQLDQVVEAVSLLGRERNRQLSSSDVTDEYVDLEARLRNLKALRGRLQNLLERAQSVPDVLAIEKELTRIQSEIESLQARFDSLSKKVEFSSLSITINKKLILGPVAYVANGIWGLFSKLFIIR